MASDWLVEKVYGQVDELFAKNNKLTKELEACENALRQISAHVLGGGYASEVVNPVQFRDRIINQFDKLTKVSTTD